VQQHKKHIDITHNKANYTRTYHNKTCKREITQTKAKHIEIKQNHTKQQRQQTKSHNTHTTYNTISETHRNTQKQTKRKRHDTDIPQHIKQCEHTEYRELISQLRQRISK